MSTTEPGDPSAGDPARSPDTVASLLRRAVSSGPVWLDVAGTSMGTSIVTGDRVQVAEAPRPRHGEVWAFCDGAARVVVHRCRGRRPGGWLFEGDAVGRADAAVPTAWLIGRVVAVGHHGVERRLGGGERLRGTIAIGIRRARRVARRSAARARRRPSA